MQYPANAIPEEAASALAPAFDRSYVHQAQDWIDRCTQGMAQLWRNGDYWAITEIIRGKDGLICHQMASAGAYNDALIDEIEGWAKSIGCQKTLATVRPGMARKRPGYRTKTITQEKEL
jgi:hypothetical protein